jgi:hypothetical protein
MPNLVVIGFEGYVRPTTVVSWGAAALVDYGNGLLINPTTHLSTALTNLQGFVNEGTIALLPESIRIDPKYVASPLVVSVTWQPNNAIFHAEDTAELACWRVFKDCLAYVFPNLEAFNAYAHKCIRAIVEAKDPSLYEAAMILDCKDPEALALWRSTLR